MPALETRSIDETASTIQIPPAKDFAEALLWRPAATRKHLSVTVCAVRQGGKIKARHHPGHMTMVICWRGKGTAKIAERSAGKIASWDPPYEPVAVDTYTSFVVPRGALYEFLADPPSSRGSPRAHCVLLMVHAWCGKPVQTLSGAFSGTPQRPFPWRKDLHPDHKAIDPETGIVLYRFDEEKAHRATRIRIWGRDAVTPAGDPNIAKSDFHLTAYCFGPGQENPAHFHPYSVEFMLGMKGKTLTYTRDKRWNQGGEAVKGWSEARRSGTISPGDTALVRIGDIHRYVNHTDKNSIVLALQTPHPIMHTLEHETDF